MHVGRGIEHGSGSGQYYRDDYGKKWTYETERLPWSIDYGLLGAKIRAKTSSYGGKTTIWRYISSVIDLDGTDTSGTNAEIDEIAEANTADESDESDTSDFFGSYSDPKKKYVPPGDVSRPPKDKKTTEHAFVQPAYSDDSLVDVQRRLISLGYDLGSTGADGKTGAKTSAAIVAFKKAHDLSPANDVVDASFRAALRAATTSSTTPASGGGGSTMILLGLAAAVAVAVVVLK